MNDVYRTGVRYLIVLTLTVAATLLICGAGAAYFVPQPLYPSDAPNGIVMILTCRDVYHATEYGVGCTETLLEHAVPEEDICFFWVLPADTDYDSEYLEPPYPNSQINYPYLLWSYDGEIVQEGQDSGGLGFFTTPDPGTHVITCTATDIDGPETAIDPEVTFTFILHVLPASVEDDGDSDSICDDGSGCSCSCSGGAETPMPSLRQPTVTPRLGSAAGPGALGGGTNPGNGCRAGQWEVRQSVESPYLVWWDEAGKSSAHELTAGQTFNTFTNTGRISATLNSEGTSVTVTTDTGTGTVSVQTPRFQHFPSSISDAAGNLTFLDYDDDTGALETVTLPNQAVWHYEHGSAYYPLNITRVTAPDGRYVKVGYVRIDQAGAGQIETVMQGRTIGETDHDDADTLTTYSYYDDPEDEYRFGKLSRVEKTGKAYYYDYGTEPTTSHPLIMITERPAGGDENNGWHLSDIRARIVYDYNGSDYASNTVTKVTQKKQLAIPYNWPDCTDTDTDDRTTTYTYYSETPHLQAIEDNLGHTTTFTVDTTRGLTTDVVGPDGTRAHFGYDLSNPPDPTDSRALLWAEARTPDDQTVLAREDYTYYDDDYNQCKTHWLKTVKDVRGNWAYCERYPGASGTPGTPGTLWKVDAVKVADGAGYGSTGPTDQQWASIDPLAEFTYYALNVNDGLAGFVSTETVHTDATNDYVVSYKYSEWVDSVLKKRFSPTEVTSLCGDGPSQSTTYFYYDEMERPLCAEDATKTEQDPGRKVWYRYDDRGRPILTIYKTTGGDPTFGINEQGELVNSNLDIYSRDFYSSCCGLQWTRDPNGNRTYYGYDDVNRLNRVWTDVQTREWSGVQTNGNGEVSNGAECPDPYWLASRTFDEFGDTYSVTTRTGPGENDGRTTAYTRDELGRITGVDYPGTALGNPECGYDVDGRLQWEMDGNGDVTLLWYDSHGRLERIYYNYTGSREAPISDPANQQPLQFHPQVVYAYEGNTDLRTSMDEYDQNGTPLRTSTYLYDFLGRLDHYTPPIGLASGRFVDYDYDNLDQPTRVRIWNGTDTTEYDVGYDYYLDGSLKNIKHAGNTIAHYSYDIVGNPTRIDFSSASGPTGAYTTYDFNQQDPRYILDKITHFCTYGGSSASFLIDYRTQVGGQWVSNRDKSGNPLSMSDWTGQWQYSYDWNQRLIGATPPSPGMVPGHVGGPYEYDWVGNRLRPPADPDPLNPSHANEMGYDEADRLLYWPGMHGDATNNGYSYFQDGSLHQVTDSAGASQVASYTYTAAGLLGAATLFSNSGSLTIANVWDADANRISFGPDIPDYPQRTLVNDVTAGIPAVLKENIQGQDIEYIRGPGGALVAKWVDGEEPHYHYYHFDELGSTRLITNKEGAVSDRYTYDAYGALISHDRYSNWNYQPYQYVGELGYYTHDQYPYIGLLQLGVRFYDPETGRFTQQDPAGDGVNWCAYVGGNPMSSVDPNGLAAEYRPLQECSWGMGEYLIENGTWAAGQAAAFVLQPPQPGEGLLSDLYMAMGPLGGVVGNLSRAGEGAITAVGARVSSRFACRAACATSKSLKFAKWQDAEDYLRAVTNGVRKRLPTALGERRVDSFVGGIANESKNGYQGLSKRLRSEALKDAWLMERGRIRGATWHFYRSGHTGKVGGSKPLLRFLKEHGINYVIHR